MSEPARSARSRAYWDSMAKTYQSAIHISVDDFHYGPLVPGDSSLRLLPKKLKGLRCLELGCGAAQNSIFLSKKGAACTALDISRRQLEQAAVIAESHSANIDFHCADMESISTLFTEDSFDLVHSSYALGFSIDCRNVLADAAALLAARGVLLLSVGHPLFAGKWQGGPEGLFLQDYFSPEPDLRFNKSGEEEVRYDYHPVSETLAALLDAGLAIEAVREPQAIPLPKPDMASAQAAAVPYYSRGWLGYYEQLRHVPAVLIVKARKP